MPSEVEVVPGDLNRPETLAPALKGVNGVFLLPGYQDMPGVITEIRRADVGRVVLLSGVKGHVEGVREAELEPGSLG